MTIYGRYVERAVVGVLATLALVAGSGPPSVNVDEPPYEPSEALELFEVADGYRVELFAAEPLVSDPVAMEIDEVGRVYVVEDHGYPEEEGHRGIIRQIRDTSGDGFPDTSIVFASGLSKPRGATAWRGGLIVTASPDILFLRDSDGDGAADERQVLATGFSTQNPQMGVNTPIYGLDNWIYMAHAHPGSRVMVGDDSVDVSRRNVRFRPDSREMEALSGRSQFGHTFDRFGRHVLTVNNNHIYQEIIAARYLARNPDLLLDSVHESISDHGDAAEVFPITDDPDYELFTDVGVITSACGITSYLGGAFAPPYAGATFVAEPVHNLVHADRLVAGGVPLVAERIEREREFLASRDRWFRPVNFYVGPDGALYVVDYYREIVEQPRFIAQEKLDADMIYNGTDRGRIYRIVPEDGLEMSWLDRLNLDLAEPEELVAWLADENIWWRRTAQRLLVSGGHEHAAAELEHLAVGAPTAEGRLHALYTLDGLGLLAASHVRSALRDAEAGVRELAVVLAESRLSDVSVAAVAALQDDPNLRVRFQVLLTLGEVNDREAEAIRRRMVLRDIDHDWMHVAALSARDLDPWSEARSLADANLAVDPDDGPGTYVRRLAAMIARRTDDVDDTDDVDGADDVDDADHIDGRVDDAVQEAVNPGRPSWWRAAVLEGIAAGIDSTRAQDLDRSALLSLALRGDPAEVAYAALLVLVEAGFPDSPDTDSLLRSQREILLDSTATEQDRLTAISMISGAGDAAVAFSLEDLMRPNVPATVQAEAIGLLARSDGEIGTVLLGRWNEMTPLVRAAASDAMARDSARIELLLDAVEAGRLTPGAVSWRARQQIMLHPDASLRRRARRLLPDQTPASAETLAEYDRALEGGGDPARGAVLFDQACGTCHQIRGRRGVRFGPDLGTVRGRPPEYLLVDILHPNRTIVSGYEEWTIDLRSGERLSGVIGEETPTSVTIRMLGGTERTVSRSEITSMKALDRSAMPEGLEAQLSVQDMADLIAFLRRGAGAD